MDLFIESPYQAAIERHPVEVVVTVGELLVGDRTADRVAEAEDLHVDAVSLGEVVGRAKPVVAGLGAVGGAFCRMTRTFMT